MLRSMKSMPIHVAMSLILLGTGALAQSTEPTSSHGGKPVGKVTSSSEQKHALWTLVQLFEVSKESQDQAFRIEAEADIADALWTHDRGRARSYFVDAFRAIDLIKRDEREAPDTATVEPTVDADKAGLHRQIAALISSHDPALAESLVRELLKSTDQLPKDRLAVYPGMAINAARIDPQRAVDMARAGLGGGITPGFINSLIAIRAIQPQLADGLFYESLAVTARDVENFSNDLRLLASYVFGPGGVPANASGGNDFEGNDTANASQTLAGSNAGLVTDFLNFALQASLAIYSESGARSAPGLMSYAPLMQLLPYYESYLPDTAATITAAFNQLVAAVPDPQKRALLLNLVTRTTTGQIMKAGDSLVKPEQKDLLYQRGALQASGKGDLEQALTIAESISNDNVRQKVKATAYVEAATRALGKGDINTACKYAIEIPDLLQQSRVFAEIIRVLSRRKELARANDVLDNAERQITQAEDGPEKARSLLLLSSISVPIDEVRAMTILQLAVVAINHSDFSDKSSKTKASTNSIPQKSEIAATVALNSFSFHQSFGILAGVDFDIVLSLARSIAQRELSIRAQIAACRGVLQRTSQHDPEIHKPKRLAESASSKSPVLSIAR